MDVYKENIFQGGRCYSRSGKDTAYYDYTQEPEFVGGLNRMISYAVQPIPNFDTRDTIYFDIKNYEVSSITSAHHYAFIMRDPNGLVLIKTLWASGALLSEAPYSNYEAQILDGVFKEYYENGQLRKQILYKQVSVMVRF